MSDTVPVQIRCDGVERLKGSGSLVGMAIVQVNIGGIEIGLQGVQVRNRAGRLVTQAPQFRCPRSGRWLPCIVLPPELSDAIGAEVNQAMQESVG